MNGIVQSGGMMAAFDVRPLSGATVTLYDSNGGQVGSSVTSDSAGRFTLPSPNSTPGIYYATAALTNGVTLLTIIGPELPLSITINELTTIAGAWSAAQFLSGGRISGISLGLTVVAGMNLNLVEIETGKASSVIRSAPNYYQTNTWQATLSLANLLATCVRGGSEDLQYFYKLATPPGSTTAPTDTLTALVNIARHPANNVGGIFAQSKLQNIYRPPLQDQPDAWTLVVKVNFSGNDGLDGQMFSGPGGLTFDSQGRAWITNNSIQGTGNGTQYGIVLDMTGKPAKIDGAYISPYTGGGLLGGGYGIAIDSNDQVWMSDFGWGDAKPPVGGVSVFTENAVPVSPTPNGYTTGVHRVQGIAIDASNNVWIAGYESNSVAMYPGGNSDPSVVPIYPGGSAFKPFGIALATDGTAWVTNGDQVGSVVHLQYSGTGLTFNVLSNTPVGKVLKGIAIDSQGNVWVASGGDDHVYVLDSGGNVTGAFQGGGINGPWGLCLDGADNPWIGNFGPLEPGSVFHGRLTQLAGVNAVTESTRLGDGLTPQSGYTLPTSGYPVTLHNGTPLYGNDGPPCFIPMMRTTGLQVDAAGNVWTCNNWKPSFDIDAFGDPFEDMAANPGGDGMLIWVGVAAPMTYSY